MKRNEPQSLSNLLNDRRRQYKSQEAQIVKLGNYIRKEYGIQPEIHQTPTKLIIHVNSSSAASQLRLNNDQLKQEIDSDQEIVIKVVND